MKLNQFQLTASIIVGAAIAGCATNLEPVGRFGAATAALTTTYRPIASDIRNICQTRLTEGRIATFGPYDYAAIRENMQNNCNQLKDGETVVLGLATVIEGYANSLVALSGVRPEVLSADIDSMNAAAQSMKVVVQDPENPSATLQQALISADHANAVAKIVKVAAEAYVSEKTRYAAKKALVEGREPFHKIVTAMKVQAQSTYGKELIDAKNDAEKDLEELVKNSSADRTALNPSDQLRNALPYRALQPRYVALLDFNQKQRNGAKTFAEACDALILSNNELVDNFDEITDPGKLARLKDLIKKTRDLRDGLSKF